MESYRKNMEAFGTSISHFDNNTFRKARKSVWSGNKVGFSFRKMATPSTIPATQKTLIGLI